MERKWSALCAAAAAVWICLGLALPDIPGLEVRWRPLSEIAGELSGPAAAQAPAPAPGTSPSPTAASAPAALPQETPRETAVPSPEAGQFTETFDAVVQNFSSQTPDIARLAAQPLTQTLGEEGAQILIIHTHGTEAYTAVPGEEYEASDPYRTTDPEHSVIRVGDALAAALESQGLRVVHDRGLYDYPSYTGSYTRSQAAAESWLERYPGIGIIIDLHRDAVDADQAGQRTLGEDGDAARVMLVIGTGENGLPHPHWRENFKLALAVQRALTAADPQAARPIRLVRERYNQHLSPGAFILEVGTNGNTLSQAIRAAELFAQAAGPVFSSLRGSE